MTKQILVGYTVEPDNPVKFYMPEKHTVICGMTGEGKTVLFERIVREWPEQKFVIFVSKIGEEAFPGIPKSKPYFKQKDASNWRYVRDLIEVSEEKKLAKHEESFLVRRCAGAKTLADVHKNIKSRMKELEGKNKTENIEYGDLVLLEQYLAKLIDDWHGRDFSTELDLSKRITVFDISDMPTSLQAAVVASVIEAIHYDKDLHHIAICVPEAWQLLPADRGSPALAPAEIFARQGRVRHNWLIIDTQDLAGVNGRKILINVHNYFLGRQQYRHEVERTRDTLPVPARIKPAADDIMNLKTGQFYAVAGQRDEAKINLIYAWPVWLDEPSVIEVAKDPKLVYKYAHRTDLKDKTAFETETYEVTFEMSKPNKPTTKETLDEMMTTAFPTRPEHACEWNDDSGICNKPGKHYDDLDADYCDEHAIVTYRGLFKTAQEDATKAIATASRYERVKMMISNIIDEVLSEKLGPAAAAMAKMHPADRSGTSADIVFEDEADVRLAIEKAEVKRYDEKTTVGKLLYLIHTGFFNDKPKSKADMHRGLVEKYGVDKKPSRFYNESLNKSLDELTRRPIEFLKQVGDGGTELYALTETGRKWATTFKQGAAA